MSVLLDTHVFLWWLTADPRLSANVRNIIGNGQIERHVSAVTAFEIANKVRIGKLEFARPLIDKFDEILAEGGFLKLDIACSHAKLAGLLSGAPRDPFDRLLAAQAISQGVPVLTADPALLALGADVVW